MAYLISIIVFWALWRRVFGGWLKLSRPMIVAIGAIASFVLFWTPEVSEAFSVISDDHIHDRLTLSSFLTLYADIWPPFVAAALTAAFWTPGHNFMDDRKLLLRYGPVGLGWIIMRRYWNPDWNLPPFIDGWTAAAELLAGSIFGMIVWALL